MKHFVIFLVAVPAIFLARECLGADNENTIDGTGAGAHGRSHPTGEGTHQVPGKFNTNMLRSNEK